MENVSFATEAAIVINHFLKLQAVVDGDLTILKGEVDVVDKNEKYWETFQVEIRPTDEYPNRFPNVFETGGKLPKIADWHVNGDGTCCIGVKPVELLACKKGITLVDFLQNEMMPYFFNQTHRRIEGYYPNGEWAHAGEGVFEFYDTHLNTRGMIGKRFRIHRRMR